MFVDIVGMGARRSVGDDEGRKQSGSGMAAPRHGRSHRSFLAKTSACGRSAVQESYASRLGSATVMRDSAVARPAWFSL